MEDTLQIRCPWCTAILKIKNQPGIESKSVTCPVCKQKSPFTSFKPVNKPGNNVEVKTELPPLGGMPPFTPTGPARLKLLPDGPVFTLKEGRNVIGRKANGSKADIAIDTRGQLRMSREHIIIEVIPSTGGSPQHVISLFKAQVNPTTVNNQPLEYGDTIYLENHAIIELPDARLEFLL